MRIFREIPPTAGFPLYLNDFLSSFKAEGSLEEDFRNYIGLDYARVTYSGTAAFYFILETIKGLASKKTIVIPAYVCPLIPLAVKRAGLKIEVCDISHDRFDYDYQELENICLKSNDILAIVAVHLAGLPLDFEAIKKITEGRGIFIIEDCAQSLGAEYKGIKTGSLADFSFFSLCRGKGLTIYEGGVALAKNKEYSVLLEHKSDLLAKEGGFSEALKIWELFGYWIFYRPQLAWFILQMPQLFWQFQGNKLRAVAEYFSEDFPVHKVSKFRKSLGHASFRRVEQEIAGQRAKADFYLEALKAVEGIRVIKELAGTKATYPYRRLVFDQPQRREAALKALWHCGLGVSQIYAYAVIDYDYLKPVIPYKDYPNGRSLAAREITLSTSTFLRESEMDSVIAKIKSLRVPDKAV
jgi:perosamine synthetase